MMRAIVILLVFAHAAHANVGRRTFPADHAAEPAGLRAIAIEHEELAFDLRPLATRSPAHVMARYELVNHGDEVTTALVFVSGALGIGNSHVTLDGTELRAKIGVEGDTAPSPASWAPPKSTPALDGGEALFYETHGTGALTFWATIGSGKHELSVTYTAMPQLDRSQDGGTIVWQLGYVLAPARDWGGFGTLDVTVQLPPGWRAATLPALARSGDTLHAHFTSLPVDTIGITVQAPTGTLHRVLQIATPLLVLVVLVGGILALIAFGRRSRGKGVAFLAGFAWAILIAVSGGFAAVRSDLALPPQQSAYYGYGQGLAVILVIFVTIAAMPIGYVIVRKASREPHAL